ncbi:MAG TPA: phage tail protein [Gaiellaceae bacterium]|jgi:phage tail-like protein
MADDDAPPPPDDEPPEPPSPPSEPPDLGSDPPDDDPPPEPPDSSGSDAGGGDRSSAADDAAPMPDPVGELRFQVLIDDAVIGDFAECTGLSMEYDVFEYQEGGQLGFVHKFRGGLKYPNIVLKRGVTYEDELLKWFLDRSDRDDRGNVTLNLLGDDGQQVRTWSFAAAFPVKWSGPSFNAKSTNVAMETLEIAHQGMIPPD